MVVGAGKADPVSYRLNDSAFRDRTFSRADSTPFAASGLCDSALNSGQTAQNYKCRARLTCRHSEADPPPCGGRRGGGLPSLNAHLRPRPELPGVLALGKVPDSGFSTTPFKGDLGVHVTNAILGRR